MNFFERVSWDRLLFCRIGVTDTPWLNHIIRNDIAICVHISRCYVATGYRLNWIFCVDIGHCLRLVCKGACCWTLNFFERVTWDRFLFCRISVTNIPWLDHIIWNDIAICVHVLRCYTATSYWIFRVDISHCLSLVCKSATYWALDFFECVTWDRLLFCRIGVTDIPWLNHIIWNDIAICVHVLRCYTATSYWIFRVDISHCLSLVCKSATYWALDFFECVTWDRLLFCRIGVTDIPWLNHIIWNDIAICVHVLRCYTATSYWIFRVDISHCLSLVCKGACCWALDFFERVTWDRFLLCRISVTDIPRLDDIIRDDIAICVHVLRCYICINNYSQNFSIVKCHKSPNTNSRIII